MKKRESIIHISKRPPLSNWKMATYYGLAILCAVLISSLFVILTGTDIVKFYQFVIDGSFKSDLSMRGLVRNILPLLITSLGVAVAFKMKFWNIGAEGQLIMGAVGATFVAFTFPNLPHGLLILLMALAGILAGGIWGLLVAFFNCKFGTNETLLTLMLNYVALYIVQWLRDGPWRDPAAKGFQKIPSLPKNAWLDQVGGIDITWIIALGLVVLLFVYFKYTKQGYEISVVGDSKGTAHYAGMNVNGIVMRTVFISAAICGLAGMLHVSGDATTHQLTMGVANGVGFTAIIVAWLAKLNPFGVLVVSFFFGLLEKSSGAIESGLHLSKAFTDVYQGIILFVILGFDFFIRYRVSLRLGSKKKNKELKGEAEQ
ncbi:MAG: ABC transporter permease [Clostridia bacterium]|nr:ABC transporter permease [Clostridia bacterium]